MSEKNLDLEKLVAQLPIHEQEKLMEQVAEYKAAMLSWPRRLRILPRGS